MIFPFVLTSGKRSDENETTLALSIKQDSTSSSMKIHPQESHIKPSITQLGKDYGLRDEQTRAHRSRWWLWRSMKSGMCFDNSGSSKLSC